MVGEGCGSAAPPSLAESPTSRQVHPRPCVYRLCVQVWKELSQRLVHQWYTSGTPVVHQPVCPNHAVNPQAGLRASLADQESTIWCSKRAEKLLIMLVRPEQAPKR